jgi:hypothetical protein
MRELCAIDGRRWPMIVSERVVQDECQTQQIVRAGNPRQAPLDGGLPGPRQFTHALATLLTRHCHRIPLPVTSKHSPYREAR